MEFQESVAKPLTMPWTIRPCEVQPDGSLFEKTHDRPMPLPFAIDLVAWPDDPVIRRYTYLGHGQSKIAFLSEDKTEVLKVSHHLDDQEPSVFTEIRLRSGADQLCPEVYDSSRCQEFDASGEIKKEWLAWRAQYTPALNKCLQLPETDRAGCIRDALYCQARAAQLGLLLSDNNLFNFGVADKRVVILDAGSRPLVKPGEITKNTMNIKAIKRWWRKLEWQSGDSCDFIEAQRLWQLPGTLDSLVKSLSPRRDCRVVKPAMMEPASVHRKEPSVIDAPFVRKLLQEHPDDEMLEWFRDTYLFDQLSTVYVLPSGACKPVEQEQPQAPYIKLDILIRIAKYHRAKWIEREDEILSDDKYLKLHHAWRNDWQSWMNEQAQREWLTQNNAWRRSRFKNMMFKIAGCAELLQFFLYVPHTYQNFMIFHGVFEQEKAFLWRDPYQSRNKLLMMAVQQVREARM
jgi:hypothetical protein